MATAFIIDQPSRLENWFADVPNTVNILDTFTTDPEAVYLACLVVGRACADYKADFSEVQFVEFYKMDKMTTDDDYLITVRYNGNNCASYGANSVRGTITTYAD